jgi:hypothetical protein
MLGVHAEDGERLVRTTIGRFAGVAVSRTDDMSLEHDLVNDVTSAAGSYSTLA